MGKPEEEVRPNLIPTETNQSKFLAESGEVREGEKRLRLFWGAVDYYWLGRVLRWRHKRWVRLISVISVLAIAGVLKLPHVSTAWGLCRVYDFLHLQVIMTHHAKGTLRLRTLWTCRPTACYSMAQQGHNGDTICRQNRCNAVPMGFA
jgi:hypothetical protein